MSSPLYLELYLNEISVQFGGKTYKVKRLQGLACVIAGESADDALVYEHVLLRYGDGLNVDFSNVLNRNPGISVRIILGFGAHCAKEAKLEAPLVRRPVYPDTGGQVGGGGGGGGGGGHLVVDIVVPPAAFDTLVREYNRARTTVAVPRAATIAAAPSHYDGRSSRGHHASGSRQHHHRDRRSGGHHQPPRRAASVPPAYDDGGYQQGDGYTTSEAASAAPSSVADDASVWSYASSAAAAASHNPQYPATDRYYGTTPSSSSAQQQQSFVDYDWTADSRAQDPVPWNEMDSYRGFRDNKSANDFWKWEIESQRWKHVDQRTGEVIYCPDELD